MAFQVSPGVRVTETDLTNIIPAVSTSIGGFAGKFKWGPTNQVTQVSSEADLIRQFGNPVIDGINQGGNTRNDWYAAANFLGYTNNLQLVRVLADGARNAASAPLESVRGQLSYIFSGTATAGTLSVPFGLAGTDTVDVTLNGGETPDQVATAFLTAVQALTNAPTAVISSTDNTEVDVTVTDMDFEEPDAPSTMFGVDVDVHYNPEQDFGTALASATVIQNEDDFLVKSEGGGAQLVNGSVYARYPGELGNGIGIVLLDAGLSATDFTTAPLFGTATAASLFDTVPATSSWATGSGFGPIEDEVHVVVYTTDTSVTGTANQVLETYSYLSKARNGKTSDGGPNYYVDVLNQQSSWVHVRRETGSTVGAPTAPRDLGLGANITTANSDGKTFVSLLTNASTAGVVRYELAGGLDGSTVDDGDYTASYDLLNDAETVDISLLIAGEANGSVTVQKRVISIAESRRDCVAYVSPSYESAVINPTAAKVNEFYNNSTTGFNSSSYAVFDSGWKRQYDRYNDEYFWIPLNADIAGLSARTDYTNEAWFSPAGLNRGFIRDVVKLSFNPNQTDRDTLYSNRINPVVTFRGQGTLLYGDKTALSRPSAFDRINVRRLFIVLEKAIAVAARFQLFEFNDDLTRRTFVNAVEPFLADILSRRGLTDFRVVCDESNNTGEVIDGNRFVADIYIKPARSINFITLNFIAVRSGVSFSEVAGG